MGGIWDFKTLRIIERVPIRFSSAEGPRAPYGDVEDLEGHVRETNQKLKALLNKSRGEEMNTTVDFENAKVGRTATGKNGVRAIKTFNVNAPWSVFAESGGVLCFNTNNQMEFGEFVLDEPEVLTAREHFDLGWEKAYPVVEGQNIPVGTEYVEKIEEGQTIIATHEVGKWNVTEYGAERVRTLDPIKNPDWTSAPAVVAWAVWDGLRTEKAWVKAGDNWMSSGGEVVDWKDLRDVTPLYPKETN